MPISRNHHDLFHGSDTSDKLDLFQTLLNARTLQPDEALALLNTIHAELEQHGGHDPSVYLRYARMMESLRQQMPAVHQEVITNWQQLHARIQQQAPESFEADAEETQVRTKRREVEFQAPPASEEIQKPLIKQAGQIHIEDDGEIEGGAELEGPEPQEEETDVVEEQQGKAEEEVENYGEEVEEEELEEKEAQEEEGREADEEENEEQEESKEEEETEAEEEKGEVDEKEEEGEEEEVKQETEEVEEKEDKEEAEEKEEETEREVEVLETEEPSTEADRMATEAAEAAHEMEHPDMGLEEQPEAEEVEINPAGEEPPMEGAE